MSPKYLDFIKKQLKETSKIASRSFGKVSGTVKPKDSNQVLTETDLEISRFLIKAIKTNFPSYNIIDEEAGVIDNGSEYTWVIDPIDGTSNFAEGIPNYGIIIGLLQNSTPIAGGIATPFFNEIVIAEKDQGAFLNDEKLVTPSKTDLKKCLVAYGIDSHPEDYESVKKECQILARIVQNIRNLRISNSTLDIVLVAKGSYGGCLNRSSRIWDNIGQQIIIEEAGGVYTDYFGNPMDYSNPLSRANEHFSWCMATPELHKQLQKIIHQDE